MINPNSKEYKSLVDSFKILKMTPEGMMIMEYLQALFLYPNPDLQELFGPVTNDEQLGHHRVILHILSLMGQD